MFLISKFLFIKASIYPPFMMVSPPSLLKFISLIFRNILELLSCNLRVKVPNLLFFNTLSKKSKGFVKFPFIILFNKK